MVYDTTKSGLNIAVWEPWFAIPTVDCHLRTVEADTFMADCDVGEMFSNFMLELSLQPYAGVDLSKVFLDEKNNSLKGCWKIMMTGFTPSPYLVTRDMSVVEDGTRGSRFDKENAFRWDKVIFNILRMGHYNASISWVFKVRENGTPVADQFFLIHTMGVLQLPPLKNVGEQREFFVVLSFCMVCKKLEGKELEQIKILVNGLELW